MQINQDNNRYFLAWFLGSGFFVLILVLIFFFLAICFIMNVGMSAKLANLIGIVKVH